MQEQHDECSANIRYLPVIVDFKAGTFRLAEDLRLCGHLVPNGFCTDFASIPWTLHWRFKKHEIYASPPVLHDFLYATHLVGRKEADLIFYDAMTTVGYEKRTIFLQYWAVRIFGWSGYYWLSPKKMKKATPELFARYFKGKAKHFLGYQYYA